MKNIITLLVFLVMTISGHAADTNLLLNPSFESGKTSWTISSGTTATETTAKVHGTRSLVIVASAQTPVLTQDIATLAGTSQFADGVQGLAMIRVRTNQSGVKVCSRSAGVTSTTNCVTVNSDSKWGLYKVPFILGATSNGISIAASSSITGNIYVDDAFVGAVDLKQDMDVVGPATSFTATGSWSTNTAYTGNWYRSGEYMYVSGVVTLSGAPTSASLTINIPSGYTIDTSKLTGAGVTTNFPQVGGAYLVDLSTQGYIGLVEYNSTTSVSFLFEVASGTNTGIATVNATNPFSFGSGDLINYWYKVPIVGWSAGSSAYSASCGANCVDGFGFLVSSGGVVSSENADVINANCTNAQPSVCTFNSGILTVAPIISIMATTGGYFCGLQTAATTTGFSIHCYDHAGNPANTTVEKHVTVRKTGADFIATRTIVGSFNEVMTTPGITKPKACYYSFGGASATLAAPTECTTGTCVEVYDSCGTGTPPTWNATALYTGITWAAGTWANNTPVFCTCSAYDTATNTVRYCTPMFTTSNQSWMSSSSGGMVLGTYSMNESGTQLSAYISMKCEGLAP